MFLFCYPRSGLVARVNDVTSLLLVNRALFRESREQSVKSGSGLVQKFAYCCKRHFLSRALRLPLPGEE
jgi:hypothetical protein